jgi:flagellin-specific chaperone FliS
MVYIQHDSTSHIAWKNLEAIYEDKSRETAVTIIHNLWHTTAEEEDDISKHLATLKKYWEHLNLVEDSNLKIPEVQFKIAIISSLPPSWDAITLPYISIHKDDNTDSRLHATSQELIEVLKEEYFRRLRCAGKLMRQEVVHQVNTPKPSLARHLKDAKHWPMWHAKSQY